MTVFGPRTLDSHKLNAFVSDFYQEATPSVKQYLDLKQQYLDCIVFFRIGDFFELFFDDAYIGNKELDLTLTKKSHKSYQIDMCGFPFHALDIYLERLVKAGYRIAICDQEISSLPSPSDEQNDLKPKVVQRAITRVVTPATLNYASLVNPDKANYLLAIYHDKEYSETTISHRPKFNDLGLGIDGWTIPELDEDEAPYTVPTDTDLDQLSYLESFANHASKKRTRKYTNKVYMAYADIGIGELNMTCIDFDFDTIAHYVMWLDPKEILVYYHQVDLCLYLRKHFPNLVVRVQYNLQDPMSLIKQFYSRYTTKQKDRPDDNTDQSDTPDLPDASKTISGLQYSESIALSLIIYYLNYTKVTAAFSPPHKYKSSDTFRLDSLSAHHLEIMKTYLGSSTGSVFDVLNKTHTKQGARMLQKFLLEPLKSQQAILRRQDYVSILLFEMEHDSHLIDQLKIMLQHCTDIDRIVTKLCISQKRIIDYKSTFQDLLNIKTGLLYYNKVQEIILTLRSRYTAGRYNTVVSNSLEATNNADYKPNSQGTMQEGYATHQSSGLSFSDISKVIPEYRSIIDTLSRSMDISIMNIRHDLHPKLRSLRTQLMQEKDRLSSIQEKFRQESGISGAKVVKNGVVGYCLEVPAKQIHKISTKILSQLTNKQNTGTVSRFKTAELEELDTRIAMLESSIVDFETEAVQSLVNFILSNLDLLKLSSPILAKIDVFLGFAIKASEANYTKPKLSSSQTKIIASRHPVLEKICQEFVSNDFETAAQSTIITGPNMGGKSTFLRQFALNILLAQIGSWVPAEDATIKIVDQIFTRIGSADSPTEGQSTFAKEMFEVKHILHNATEKSLILLDEIGRGTSALEGEALAAAILKFISEKIGATCLFATHYHNLAKQISDKIGCYYVDIIEDNAGQIQFTYQLKPGFVNKSYAVPVAKAIGLPDELINWAKDYISQ